MAEAISDFLCNANPDGDADLYNAYVEKLDKALQKAISK